VKRILFFGNFTSLRTVRYGGTWSWPQAWQGSRVLGIRVPSFLALGRGLLLRHLRPFPKKWHDDLNIMPVHSFPPLSSDARISVFVLRLQPNEKFFFLIQVEAPRSLETNLSRSTDTAENFITMRLFGIWACNRKVGHSRHHKGPPWSPDLLSVSPADFAGDLVTPCIPVTGGASFVYTM